MIRTTFYFILLPFYFVKEVYMKEKEIAQRIMAMYHSQASPEDKQQFVQLLKDIVRIIENMNKEDFAQFVDDFERHLNEIDDLKNNMGIKEKQQKT